MNCCLRNSRSVLLRRYKPAQPPVSTLRYHQHIHTAPWGWRSSEVLNSTTRGIFFRRTASSYHRPSVSPSSLYASDPWMPPPDRPWYCDPWKVAAAVLLPYAAYRAVTHEEMVPYTNRVHRVLPYPSNESRPLDLDDVGIDIIKKRHGDSILGPSDPNTVRVRRIADEIICGGVHRVLLAESPCDDDGNSSDPAAGPIQGGRMRPHTEHLRGLNWKVFVVRDERQRAYSTCSGKIVVYTGLLDCLDTDAEIATVLAHEMGHVVARHTIELHEFVESLIPFLSRLLPFSRRSEAEADRIGIMLLAAAGFDPRLVHEHYQKQGENEDDSAWKDYVSTHPSFKTRSRLLSQGKVMEEALELYHKQAHASKGAD